MGMKRDESLMVRDKGVNMRHEKLSFENWKVMTEEPNHKKNNLKYGIW